MSRWRPGNAIYGRPGATYLDMPDDIIRGTCDLDKVAQAERVPEPPRMVAPTENVEAALNLLEQAQRPLVLLGKGMAWSRGEDEVRAFIERTQVPFVRSPMGKGVMPDDHPLSAGAARTLALQQADVIFLMGARLNWIFHFGLPPRYAKDVKVIQLDIAPEEIGHNKPTEVALVGDGKAIIGAAQQGARSTASGSIPRTRRGGRRLPRRRPKMPRRSSRRSTTTRRRPATTGRCATSPPGCRRTRSSAPRVPAPWISASRNCRASTPVPSSTPAPTARWASASARPSPPAVADPSRPVVHLSGDSAIGFSGMEMETLVRYNLPVKIVVLNNGGIGPGMPEIPENPMFNLKPNALIYGARYDKVMEAFGGKGLFVKEPKDIRKALDEAMAFPGPALVNVVLSQGSTRKAQQFAWHS